MKAFTTGVAALLLAAAAAYAQVLPRQVQTSQTIPGVIITKHAVGELGANPFFCKGCVTAAVQELNVLANEILNEGIIGGCSTLCSKLEHKAEQVICDGVCIGLGMDAFIHLLTRRGGPDFIYYCELAHLCAINDCKGDCLDIDNMKVQPSSGSEGTTFVVDSVVDVKNITGTGMTRITMYAPDGESSQQDLLDTGFAPGNYSMQISVDSSQLQSGDGEYTLELQFCEGMCDLQYPYTRTFAAQNVTFTVTK